MYEPVIGLEIHAQLQTRSKIFASDPVLFGQESNTLISAITLGHPGTLPKLNKTAVEFAIKMGIALGSKIAPWQNFDRKNYFYPDLPKGYQITQDKTPICIGGAIRVQLASGEKALPFHHVHLEEDAGKSLHEGDNPFSFLDYNRAGTPLIEMVTEPAIHSAEEAFAMVSEVRKLVRYLGICDGNMEEGSLRCDVNVSLRKKGTSILGTKVEIKNMNSLRNIQRAIEHECVRQEKVLTAGDQVIQETRTFDAHAGITHSMRVKESMNDYRYFPEPDLPPFVVTDEYIQEIRQEMPALPEQTEWEGTASIFAEDKMLMQVRMGRVTHPNAWSQAPMWATSHVIGNIVIESESAKEVVVRSRFHMMELRRDNVRHFGGTYRHTLEALEAQQELQKAPPAVTLTPADIVLVRTMDHFAVGRSPAPPQANG